MTLYLFHQGSATVGALVTERNSILSRAFSDAGSAAGLMTLSKAYVLFPHNLEQQKCNLTSQSIDSVEMNRSYMLLTGQFGQVPSLLLTSFTCYAPQFKLMYQFYQDVYFLSPLCTV